MSFWLRAASLPDRPPMAVNLLSIDVIFFGGHRGAVRSVQQFWGLRACARQLWRGAGCYNVQLRGVGAVRQVRPPLRVAFAHNSASSFFGVDALVRVQGAQRAAAREKAVDGWLPDAVA